MTVKAKEQRGVLRGYLVFGPASDASGWRRKQRKDNPGWLVQGSDAVLPPGVSRPTIQLLTIGAPFLSSCPQRPSTASIRQ